MNTIQELFNSGYEGVISEVGVGVPVQHDILMESGASNFLLMGMTPYHKSFQPQVQRSVSEQAVVKMAQASFNHAKGCSFPREGKKLFAMAISGATVPSDNKSGAENHAWICIVTEDNIFVVHAVIRCHNRRNTIKRFGYFARTVLHSALCDQPLQHIYGITIDVIRWPNFSIEDKIIHANNQFIYFDEDGHMQRATDILRKAKRIYRGSFNPPTLVHIDVGEDALFEISGRNFSKGENTPLDLSHRVKMLNLLGKGVLISRGFPRFINFNYAVKTLGSDPNIEYVMGGDVFNKLVIDSDQRGFIEELENLNLCVNKRGVALHHHHRKLPKLKIIDRHNGYSSTAARNGDHSGLDPRISQYILDNKLY